MGPVSWKVQVCQGSLMGKKPYRSAFGYYSSPLIMLVFCFGVCVRHIDWTDQIRSFGFLMLKLSTTVSWA